MAATDGVGRKEGFLLNWDFVLLWAGHLGFEIGAVVYGIALGFWILERTGSTTMALISASVVLPKLLLGPLSSSSPCRPGLRAAPRTSGFRMRLSRWNSSSRR